jgi:hypothetical protein
MRVTLLLILSSLLALSCGSEPVPGPGRNVTSPAVTAAAVCPLPLTPLPAEEESLAPPAGVEIVEIKENFFLGQISDIYLNPDEYIGRIIKLEGMWFVAEEEGEAHAMVIRYGPGCCANDAVAGFEVIWDEKSPQDDAWVEACGLLEKYRVLDEEYLRLRLSSLQVLQRRGMETVWR